VMAAAPDARITPRTAPPFAYYGGKTRLASRIAALFPPHRHYVEPFAGSLAVLLAKPPVRLETVNDLDTRLVCFWRVLRDRPAELARLCALTPHSRAEHAAAGQPVDNELEQARRVWVQLIQGRSGGLRPTGWKRFLSPAGPNLSMPGYLSRYTARMPAATARLAGVSLECRPALEVIADYGAHPDTLLYIDPPYLRSAGDTGSPYRQRMHTETDHRRLADALRACRARVLISGYPSPLYDRLYTGWHHTTLAASTGRGTGPLGRRECIWTNYRPPAPTQQPRQPAAEDQIDSPRRRPGPGRPGADSPPHAA
jgi:DNA adenine methylase